MTTNETLERIARSVWEPGDLVRDALRDLTGDLVIIGAGGKMGVSLSRMAAAALDGTRTVYAVSRFSDPAARAELEENGVETVSCDLLDADQIAALPDAAAVVFMAGRKFGTTGDSAPTWASNTIIPALVAQRYRDSRIAVFSSGNVYPLVPSESGGAHEGIEPQPVGEYAQSCLGREKIFTYYAERNGTPISIIRLNYANDGRYGVLTDIAKNVIAGTPVSLGNGMVNVIWQGDANRFALASLAHADNPPRIINVTGPETASVRRLAEEIGGRLGLAPTFEGTEAPTALLSDAGRSFGLFGYPQMPLAGMLDTTVEWIRGGGALLDKPTHFTEREGKY